MVSASRSKATVLVVEDDALTRELLAQLLQAGGYDVIATPTGERALLVLCHQGEEIDWLVSKVSLPGLVCGWVLADEYHDHHPGRPALLLSDLDPAAPRSKLRRPVAATQGPAISPSNVGACRRFGTRSSLSAGDPSRTTLR